MTILELTIALGIFVIIMTSAFPLIDGMVSRLQMARDHYAATSLCQARIERARSIPYSNLNLMAEDGRVLDDVGNLATGGRFRRTTTVATDVPSAGLTTMTVTVQPCICSRWGWRKTFHPISAGDYVCRFTEEHETLDYIFTDYQ